LGIASLDPDAAELRNNIELDMLRRASNGETVDPEAYQHDGQWLLSLAVGVKAEEDKYARGAVLVSVAGEAIGQLLSQFDGAVGKTELIQTFRQKEQVVASAGSAGDSSRPVSAATATTHWQLRLSPNSQWLASQAPSSNTLWLLMIVLIVLVLVTAAYGWIQTSKALQKNLGLLLAAKNKDKSAYTLPGFAQAAEELASRSVTVAAAHEAPEVKEIEAEVVVKDKPAPVIETAPAATMPAEVPATIFRAYDIRGIADTQLTDELVHAIGLAVGSEALDQGQQRVIVAADGRHSSPRIKEAMIKGLRDSGRDVIDIGTVPTPLMYFATHQLEAQSGVMITGSHNPAEYNGIKIVIGGRALSGAAIAALRERILRSDVVSGAGAYQTEDIAPAYIDYIANDVAIAQPLKIVVDAGNGVAGRVGPQVFEELGCEVVPLYCEIDGSFPNHHPDPTVEANLQDLIRAVQQEGADLGIAFDGDGDRLGVVTATGQIVPADRLLMLLAQDVVSRNPGADILFDVKCTRNLNTLISNYGGRPIMWKTGHSFMKEKMAETGALLGGEFSGHIFFKERWFGFDDGIYAATRLIEILSTTDPDLDNHLAAFPDSISSPELKVESDEEQKFAIIEQLSSSGQFGEGKLSTLDGVRVDYPDGWGLVRASNTTPMLILRFEADTEEAMTRIKTLFKEQLIGIDNSLQFSF
jgi:phosphomannomutase/phosphoglucomutase